jgi:hypothetical protein
VMMIAHPEKLKGIRFQERLTQPTTATTDLARTWVTHRARATSTNEPESGRQRKEPRT